MKTTFLATLGALGLALTPTAVDAQCAAPDGLNGPCCAPAQANLPQFPALNLPGMGICWQSCNPVGQPCVDIKLDVPVRTNCDQYVVDMTATDCLTGLPVLTGKIQLDYTRNWDEAAPGAAGTFGSQYGVWRFVAKADLSGFTPGIAGCPVPPSLTTYPTAFYYGYADYALDCTTGAWEGSLVLYHACDKFIHDPLISSQPGVFAPAEAYALVGPSTPANPFVPALAPAPGGPIIAEATRRSADPASLACTTEEPVQGDLVPLGQACACPFSAAPPQVTARLISGVSACGSSFTSVNTFPTFPWLNLMTTSIGRWSTTASYPGPEAAWVDEGPILYTEGCSGNTFAEIFYGGSTAQGYDVIPNPITPVSQNFLDIASNYSTPLGAPIALPLVGNVMPTRHLIYVNTP